MATTDRTTPPLANGKRPEKGHGPHQRAPHRRVQVSSVTALSPKLRRMVVGGELQDWPVSVPGGHFKIFVPQAGSDELAMRTYTVRRYDADRAELTIDFAIHAGGPATAFAQAATPGDAFEISGAARPGFTPGEGSQWTVLIADHSALPAVCATLELLPAGHRAQVLVEVPAVAEQLELASSAVLSVQWLTAGADPCARLVDAARSLTLPAGDGEIWVGCEAGAMRAIRRHFLEDRGVGSGSLHTRAYWKRGVAAHSDHDTGDETAAAR